MDHAMKECEVANFHGHASDAYVYVWMVQGSLCSWIALWNLCHTLIRCKGSLFSWEMSWLLSHGMKEGQVANFHVPCNEGMWGS
jgi:hypothetical protein